MHRKRPKRPIITKNYALQGFQLVIPEMFSNFVKVSFYKHSTNISNDMTKKLILAPPCSSPEAPRSPHNPK